MKFELKSDYSAKYDQEKAIKNICSNTKKGNKFQVLLGVTGSGKTFSVANVIERMQLPTLVISHNKTLAGQLYQEFRDFFPINAVSYFVSYYDYYQPEAYIPSTDTYIEKDADVNELIDKLRLEATANILTRKDVIVIASVSCIYNIGSPREYGGFVFEAERGMRIQREQIIERLVDLHYERGEFGFHRGTFLVRGDEIMVFPAYKDIGMGIGLEGDRIQRIWEFDPVGREKVGKELESYVLFPSKHFMMNPREKGEAFKNIRNDLEKRVAYFKKQGKEVEAFRIRQKVNYELEMIEEVGYVKGIENYSRYFDGREEGDPPFTLLDYFREAYGDKWMIVVDESHISFPQIRGMHAGDLSRKKTLIEYGFRLPAALDNRPLMFDEFMRRVPRLIATSATPADWEKSMAGKDGMVELLLRPTGIPDPEVEIRPTKTQVIDVIEEVKKRVERKQRVLITTLTKKTAEDLSEFMKDKGLKVHYLHSDVNTLERSDTLDDLREGKYDALVGINLLREGLDLPEVSLVAILDADKEGFLRSEVTLIQTMGRAARHVEGKVILYADRITGSIERALAEVGRRREYQLMMNKKLGIEPMSIKKPIREKLIERDEEEEGSWEERMLGVSTKRLPEIDGDNMTPMDRKKLLKILKSEMRIAASELNFELAIEIRDKIRELNT